MPNAPVTAEFATVIVGQLEPTVNVIGKLAEQPFASVTVTMNEKLPLTVARPEMMPLPLNERPVGNLPAVMANR